MWRVTLIGHVSLTASWVMVVRSCFVGALAGHPEGREREREILRKKQDAKRKEKTDRRHLSTVYCLFVYILSLTDIGIVSRSIGLVLMCLLCVMHSNNYKLSGVDTYSFVCVCFSLCPEMLHGTRQFF